MRRRLLVGMTAGVALFGLVLLAVPFVGSLNPSARAVGELPHVDLSQLGPGEFRVLEVQLSRIFVLRLSSGELRVFSVPYSNDREVYFLPDISWSRSWIPCEEFGPEVDSGQLAQDGIFRCHSGSPNEFWDEEHRWDFGGDNLGSHTEDLPVPRHEVAGQSLIIGK
jgi:hypothetical protein